MIKKNKHLSLLLICVLGLSSIPLLSAVDSVSASTGAVNFLPNYWYNGTGSVDTGNEISLALTTAQYITALLANKYPSSYFSAYGTTCTLSTYQTVTSYLQNNYDYVVIYSKGHRGFSGGHISLADHYGDGFYDANIYFRTSYAKNKFSFIWHCQTAEYYNYGGPNIDGLGLAVGMPYAFTHNNYLTQYGTTGDQVYLGWKDKNPLIVYNYTTQQYHNIQIMGGTLVGSPQYEWGINPTYNYAHVAYLFWASVCGGSSTITALNDLSYTIYGQPFTSNSNLYGWLMVYGNRNLGLPA